MSHSKKDGGWDLNGADLCYEIHDNTEEQIDAQAKIGLNRQEDH